VPGPPRLLIAKAILTKRPSRTSKTPFDYI
jgi:hypothetical protein